MMNAIFKWLEGNGSSQFLPPGYANLNLNRLLILFFMSELEHNTWKSIGLIFTITTTTGIRFWTFVEEELSIPYSHQLNKSFSSFQSIRAFTPLCENMPGGGATKPGDVVKAMNGKTIQVSFKPLGSCQSVSIISFKHNIRIRRHYDWWGGLCRISWCDSGSFLLTSSIFQALVGWVG